MVSMVIATGNRGDHAKQKEIREFLEGTDITCLTEMMSEDQTREALRNSKTYGIYEGDREGSAANPLVWRHSSIEIRWRRCVPLIPEGKRDGKYNMQKSMNLVMAYHREARQEFLFGGVHQIQTVYTKDRYPAAKLFVSRVDDRLGEGEAHPTFVGGDWNAVYSHAVMKELRQGDWRGDPTMKPGLNTFGNRNIDYFCYRNLDKKMVIDNIWTQNIQGSDHNGKKLRVKFR
jgi:hypothetical protein